MTTNPAPPTYEQNTKTASTIASNAVRARTAGATVSSSDGVVHPTHIAPPAPKPVPQKHKTKKGYWEYLTKFKEAMIFVYIFLAISVVFSVLNLMNFNKRSGCGMCCLALAQLGGIPLWCRYIWLSFRAVTHNEVGDEKIIKTMRAVIVVCLNMQAALAYVDLEGKKQKDDSFLEGLERILGVFSFLGAVAGELWFIWEAAYWFHYTVWEPAETTVYRALPDRLTELTGRA
ncbi:hypothetical protein HK104_008355 [Borealophlyctis nickersoniae]|nr:hypothetical protein HK104_008355 [Borealophlyctis nickersoniae]